jgi:hypothetical protein
VILQGNWVCVFGKNVRKWHTFGTSQKKNKQKKKLIDQLKCKKSCSNVNILWWSILHILQLHKSQLLKTKKKFDHDIWNIHFYCKIVSSIITFQCTKHCIIIIEIKNKNPKI